MIFGYEDLLDILRSHHKIGLYLGVISMHTGSLLKINVQHGEYLFYFSNIILGA